MIIIIFNINIVVEGKLKKKIESYVSEMIDYNILMV